MYSNSQKRVNNLKIYNTNYNDNTNYNTKYNTNTNYNNGSYKNYGKGNNKLCSECVETHDQKYEDNYVWLDALGYGQVELVWFCEPANSKKFVLYTTEWWEAHCKKVSHGNNLFEAHYNAFVNPKTRFAKMVFLFEDGTLKEADAEFYKLEQDYYDNQSLCR